MKILLIASVLWLRGFKLKKIRVGTKRLFLKRVVGKHLFVAYLIIIEDIPNCNYEPCPKGDVIQN